MAAVAGSIAASIAYAGEKYPVAAVPDLTGACRAGDPMQCFVPAAEEWQAKYRKRCAEARQRCTFRPDGTILSWTSEFKPSPQLVEAMRQLRAKRDANEDRGRWDGEAPR